MLARSKSEGVTLTSERPTDARDAMIGWKESQSLQLLGGPGTHSGHTASAVGVGNARRRRATRNDTKKLPRVAKVHCCVSLTWEAGVALSGLTNGRLSSESSTTDRRVCTRQLSRLISSAAISFTPLSEVLSATLSASVGLYPATSSIVTLCQTGRMRMLP